MKNYINSVQLLGYAGQDPEVKVINDSTKLVKVRIATNTSYKDKQGNYQDVTKWHSLVAWNQVAERLAEDVSKGSRLLIHGSLDPRSYTAEDGTTRYTNDIKVEQFYVLHQDKRQPVEA